MRLPSALRVPMMAAWVMWELPALPVEVARLKKLEVACPTSW
jgi:hypothetical protein